jgi:hypothetical protein
VPETGRVGARSAREAGDDLEAPALRRFHEHRGGCWTRLPWSSLRLLKSLATATMFGAASTPSNRCASGILRGSERAQQDAGAAADVEDAPRPRGGHQHEPGGAVGDLAGRATMLIPRRARIECADVAVLGHGGGLRACVAPTSASTGCLRLRGGIRCMSILTHR